MNFHQIFKVIDAASLGMSDEEYNIILETFLVPDANRERDIPGIVQEEWTG